MNFLRIFAILTAFGPASAASADAICPLVAKLNGFLTSNSPYAAVDCPEVGFSVLPDDGAVRSQAGAYFPQTGRIELAPDLDLTTSYGQSFLLHELVHAAQFAAGIDQTVPCVAALEAEAYRLQAGFLRDAGLQREAVLTGFLADQLGSCGAPPEY
jgi:hypothetical protein